LVSNPEYFVVVRRATNKWVEPFCFLGIFFLLLIPAAAWAGWYETQPWFRFQPAWNEPWVGWLVGFIAILLIVIPLCWVTTSRVLDVFAMVLSQNALTLIAYYFIADTSANLGASLRPTILSAVSLVVLINAIGFIILFAVFAMVYAVCAKRNYPLPLPPSAPKLCDAQLLSFLRFVTVVNIVLIVLPMVVTRTIPLLSADVMEARYVMLSSDASRALYNLGTALVPFSLAGMACGILRDWRRYIWLHAPLGGMLALAQLLSGQRLPLAVALLVTVTLITLERKFPRWIMPGAYIGFILFFMTLNGFTALLRLDSSALEGENPIAASVNEAFKGNNIIDLRDASWVLGSWDFQPLEGQTYLGGLVSLVPSAIFPQKHDWHLGLTCIRIVGWGEEEHFGVRITYFGESFLNFGWAGVVGLAIIMGTLYGVLLRALHLAGNAQPPCLFRNIQIVVLMQMCHPLTNTSDAFTFWAMLFLFLGMNLWIKLMSRGRLLPVPA